MGRKPETTQSGQSDAWDVWDSGFKTTPVKIFCTSLLEKTLEAIQDKVGGDEFSVLCKGKWVSDTGFVISDEYYIPKQEVAGASVDYEEDISLHKRDGWNVVMHSHPFTQGKGGFSIADDETINTHFECSVLITGSGISKAVLNLDHGGVRIQIECNDFENYGLQEEFDIDVSNIKKRTYGTRGTTMYDNDYGHGGYGQGSFTADGGYGYGADSDYFNRDKKNPTEGIGALSDLKERRDEQLEQLEADPNIGPDEKVEIKKIIEDSYREMAEAYGSGYTEDSDYWS